MTTREKTCTDHLHDAMAALSKDNVTASDVQAAFDAVERALAVIQLARCEAMSALDKF